MSDALHPKLRRDRLTVSLYGYVGTWGYFLYGFSPIVPLLASEQGISRGEAGLHGTALAAASVVVGLTVTPIVRRVGRRGLLYGSASLLIVGTVLLMAVTTTPLTLTAVFLTGLGGSSAMAGVQPALAVHHRAAAPAAITEANGVGTLVGLLAPLAVGFTVGQHWGWRPAVGVTMVLAAASFVSLSLLPTSPSLSGRSIPRTAPRGDTVLGDGSAASRAISRLPGKYWCFWLGAIIGGAIEAATTYWGADVIHSSTGAPVSAATAAIAALIAGMALSRFIFGPISLRKAPEKLLLVSYLVAAVGWFVLWSAATLLGATIGLVIAGLGYGAHYPLAVALALRAAPHRPESAQALITLGGGAMAGITPTLLGLLADAWGPHQAFLVVPVLLVVATACIALGLHFVYRDLAAGRIPSPPLETTAP